MMDLVGGGVGLWEQRRSCATATGEVIGREMEELMQAWQV